MIRLFGTVSGLIVTNGATVLVHFFFFLLCLSVGSLFAWKDSQRQWEQMLSGVVSAGYSGYWTWKTGPGNKGLRSSSACPWPTWSVSSGICIRETLAPRASPVEMRRLLLASLPYVLYVRPASLETEVALRDGLFYYLTRREREREIFVMITVILPRQQTARAFCSSNAPSA